MGSKSTKSVRLCLAQSSEDTRLPWQRGSDSLPHERITSLPTVATPREPSIKENVLDLSKWDNWPNCKFTGAHRSQDSEAASDIARSRSVGFSRASKEEAQHDPLPASLMKAEVHLHIS